MAPLLILPDATIHSILLKLTRPEIKTFMSTLEACLKSFSTTPERHHQPEPSIVNRPTGQKCLFRPFTSPTSVGTKIIVQPVTGALHGLIALCDADGTPTGLLNAEDVTGYRTALSALIPFTWRRHVSHIVIFGAGKQALWHLRLALALRGEQIKSVTIINRTASRAEALAARMRDENDLHWKSDAKISYLDPSQKDYVNRLAFHLENADVIFCTSGAAEPLFSAGDLNGATPYISAVGSWQPDMIELDPKLLEYVETETSTSSSKAGSLLVDDRDGVLQHTGEAIRSKISAKFVVEIGEILALRDTEACDEELRSWMSDDLLVYKSVGVGMMDLAAGNAILDIARNRGLGHVIPAF